MKFFITSFLLVTLTVFSQAMADEEPHGAESLEDEAEPIDPVPIEDRELAVEEVDEPRNYVHPGSNANSLEFQKCSSRGTWPTISTGFGNSCNVMASHQSGAGICRKGFTCCYTLGKKSRLLCVSKAYFTDGINGNENENVFPY